MGYEKTYHCFHGTTLGKYESIQATRRFIYEERKNHWLGNGVYFFLDDYAKAQWWSRMAVKKQKQQDPEEYFTPCVLYLEAKVDIDKVIDLNIESGAETLNNFITFLRDNGMEIEAEANPNLSEKERQHYFRCTVMDLLVKSKDYMASCYLFPDEEHKPYKFKELTNYGIVANKGNQICIYDQSVLDFSTIKIYD